MGGGGQKRASDDENVSLQESLRRSWRKDESDNVKEQNWVRCTAVPDSHRTILSAPKFLSAPKWFDVSLEQLWSSLPARLRGENCVPGKNKEKVVLDTVDDEEEVIGADESLSSGEEVVSETEFALMLSPEEHALIYDVGPVFFQGRSGTGKTTVLEHRALAQEQVFSQEGRVLKEVEPPLTLLVTASPFLAASIAEHYERLRRGVIFGGGVENRSDKSSFAAETPAPQSHPSTGSQTQSATALQGRALDPNQQKALMAQLPPDFRFVDPATRTLCVTFSKFLQMLDGSIRDGEQFFRTPYREEKSGRAGGVVHVDVLEGGDRVADRSCWGKLVEVDFDRFLGVYWLQRLEGMLSSGTCGGGRGVDGGGFRRDRGHTAVEASKSCGPTGSMHRPDPEASKLCGPTGSMPQMHAGAFDAGEVGFLCIVLSAMEVLINQ